MTTFLLVRHGQSVANLRHCFAGNMDFPLTQLGHDQARCTAEFIASHYRVDAVYSSDLCRAYQTAEHCAQLLALPVCKDASLREIMAGRWEGMAFDDLITQYPEDYHIWMTDIGHCRCTAGESAAELASRIRDALDRIAGENSGKTVAVFTHATPIRTVQWHMTGLPLHAMQQIPWVSNASVTEIIWDNGVLVPVKISQDAHLSDLKTSLPANV